MSYDRLTTAKKEHEDLVNKAVGDFVDMQLAPKRLAIALEYVTALMLLTSGDENARMRASIAKVVALGKMSELHDEKQDMVKQMKQDLRDGKITASTQSVSLRPGETVSWDHSPTVTGTVAYVSAQHGFGAQVGLELSTGTDMDFIA